MSRVKKVKSFSQFWGHINKERKRQGLSFTALSKKAGLPNSTISAFRHNKRQMNLGHLYALVKALGGDMRKLLADLPKDDPVRKLVFFLENNPEKEEELMELMDIVTPENLAKLLTIAKTIQS